MDLILSNLMESNLMETWRDSGTFHKPKRGCPFGQNGGAGKPQDVCASMSCSVSVPSVYSISSFFNSRKYPTRAAVPSAWLYCLR